MWSFAICNKTLAAFAEEIKLIKHKSNGHTAANQPRFKPIQSEIRVYLPSAHEEKNWQNDKRRDKDAFASELLLLQSVDKFDLRFFAAICC